MEIQLETTVALPYLLNEMNQQIFHMSLYEPISCHRSFSTPPENRGYKKRPVALNELNGIDLLTL